RVAQRLCGRDQNEQPRVRRQLIEAMRIALFDLARYRLAVGQPEATGELGGAPGARQLEEGERIAVALGDDLVADREVERAVDVAEQQRARIAVSESVDGQLGESGEDVVTGSRACRTDERDALG